MSDQKQKIERYKSLQADYLGKGNIGDLKFFIQHIVSEEVPLVASRQVLQELAAALSKLAPEQLKEVGLFAVEHIHPRVTSFEEQAATIREALAAQYESEEEWSAAAKMLAGIPLDSGIRVLDDGYKVEKYIKIAMLFLQDDESVSAETYINRASLLIDEDTDGALKLQHKVCYARILDAKRKFLEVSAPRRAARVPAGSHALSACAGGGRALTSQAWLRGVMKPGLKVCHRAPRRRQHDTTSCRSSPTGSLARTRSPRMS